MMSVAMPAPFHRFAPNRISMPAPVPMLAIDGMDAGVRRNIGGHGAKKDESGAQSHMAEGQPETEDSDGEADLPGDPKQ